MTQEFKLNCRLKKNYNLSFSAFIHSGIVGRCTVHGNTVWTNSWNRNPLYSNMISIGM